MITTSLIGVLPRKQKPLKIDFQTPDSEKIIMSQKEGVKPPVIQQIEYTDFPLPEIRLYVCDNVLMLPSEY